MHAFTEHDIAFLLLYAIFAFLMADTHYMVHLGKVLRNITPLLSPKIVYARFFFCVVTSWAERDSDWL